VDQSSTIFLFNAGKIIVDNAVYRLPISPSVPEIFAFKVKKVAVNHDKFQMSFALPNFKGVMPPSVVPHYHPYLAAVSGKSLVKFHRQTPKISW